MVHGLSKHAMKLLEKDQTFCKLSHAQKSILKKKIENTTPSDPAAWEDFMVKIVKGRVCVKFLNDQKLKQIIKSARKNISKQYSREIVGHDPDMPECYYWDENECAKWICMNNHPELKEAFLLNHICGRKLVALDACALAKMGYNRFNDIKDVTLKIRELLEIPRPNMMRALARLVPREIFLKKRIYNGRNYDKLTFQKFCDNDGFPYHYLKGQSVNASIPATGKTLILLADDAEVELIEDGSENNSLVDTPTVEFIARNVTIRNRIIQSIIDNLLDHVTRASKPASVNATKHGDDGNGDGDGAQMWDDIMDLVKKGMLAMGLEDEGAESFGKEKLEFIRDVGKSLVKEMVRTEEVLRDINATRENIRQQISTQEFEDMRKVAGIFIEDVMPIAALLALGELDLETMFKRQPDLQEFVSHVVGDSRKPTKTSMIANTIDFVNEVTEEAKITLVSLLYPDLPIEEIRLAAGKSMNALDDLIRNVFQDYDEQQKAEAELDYFVSNLDPLPRPSQIQQGDRGLLNPLAVQVVKDDEKFDSEGNPILERLNSVELDQVINSQIIYTQDGDPKIVNTDNIIEKAKLEKTNRKTKRQEAYNRYKNTSKAQGAQGKKFSSGAGKRTAEAEELEETITQNKKYDSAGVPILSKLNDEELHQIITKGVVNRGQENGEDVLQNVSHDIIIAAQAEKRRREQAEFLGKVRFTDYRRNYPGQVDQYGRYEEYNSADKVDESGPVPKLIISRLNTGDLEGLITDGMLNGKTFNLDNITREAVKGELERRLLETVQDKLRWQAYQRKYPGKITPDGDFKEYSAQDKFDSNRIPVIPAMNDEELESVIMNGFTHGEDGGIQYVTEDVIAKALQEKLDRSHEQDQLELQFDSFRRNYPGKYDNENIYQEYTASEKLDRLNLPILARLNTKELEKFIQTGTFENLNLNNISKVDKDKLIQNAKLENEKRQQEELITQVEQGIKHLNFPGAVVQGQFKEYSLQAKFNKLNGYPILKRINNDEINEILEFGLIPLMETDTGVISKIYNMEFLEQVKQEKLKRQEKKSYALKQLELLQDKIVRRVMFTQATNISNNSDPNQQNQNQSLSPGSNDGETEKPGKVPAPTTAYYKDPEKYDANQQLIMERLTDAELAEIIQASALENTQQAIMDQAEAIIEQQRRLDEQEQVRRWKIKNQQKLVQAKNSKETSIAALNKIIQLEAAGKGQTIRNMDTKYQSILEKQQNGLNSNSKEKNPTTEQRRQNTLDHIMGLIDQQNTIRTDSILFYQMSLTTFDEKIKKMSKAYLALFSGFIIDHESNIVGTVDPIDGQIKNTSGEVTGIVRPDGIVLLKGQTAPLGILGADVEQIGRGKFRAIPKPVNPDALTSTNLRIIEHLDPTEEIAPWNVLQASVQGEVFVDDGDSWVQETIIPGKPDPNTGIRLAQQIQMVGGFNPEHVVILDDDTAVKIALQRDKNKKDSTKRGILKQSDFTIPETRQKYNFDVGFDTDDDIEFPTTTIDAEDNVKAVTFEWKRKEKRKVVRTLARLDDGMAKLSLSKTAIMTKGKTTRVKIVPNSNFLVTVPVSGKWGVQEVPHDEEIPHIFKPPAERKFFDPSEWQAKVDDVGKSNVEASAGFQFRGEGAPFNANETPSFANLSPSKKQVRIQTDEMLHGEPKILIGEDGKTIGAIQIDGKIYSIEEHEYIGKIKSNGILVNAQGLHMPTPSGFKIARQNGVVVANISEKGKVEKPKEIDRFLIGRIWADGRIVSMDNTLIGVVGKDGQILGAGGKSIGLFTHDWELLGTNGVPFAHVTSEGKVYRFEVIPQQKQTNKRKLSDSNDQTEKKVQDPNNNAAAAAKGQRRKESGQRNGAVDDELDNERERNSLDYGIPGYSQAIIAARQVAESENEKIMMELMEKKKEIEKLRREEDGLRRYDKDDSHKVGKTRVASRAVSFSTDIRDSFDDASSLQSRYTGSRSSMNSGTSSGRSPRDQAIFLKEKRDHRATLVENWAHEVGSLGSIPGQEYFSLDPSLSKEDRQRIVRMAADSIVDDIFKLALTRLLLQAEAGKDTATIMAAFAKIRTTGEDYTQAMWKIDGYAYDNSSTFVLNKKMKIPGKRHRKQGDKSALDIGEKVPKEHGTGPQDGKPITKTEKTADAGTHTEDANAKNYPPLIKEHDGKERERRHSRQPHRHRRRNTIQRRRSSHAQSLEEHEHEQQHNLHERQDRDRGHGHHRRHRQRRESGESDEGSIERTHKHPRRTSVKSDEDPQEHRRRQTIPDTKGLFKRIIDADEIQKAVIAQMPFTRLEQQALGGTGQPPSGRKNTLLSQGGKEHQQHHGRLPHIPLPDSQQHHLLQQANKEERAEEIHHGFHQLEARELPTHPQRRNTRTSK